MRAAAQTRPSSTTASHIDGIFYSLMVGIGETYLPAFALVAGASDTVSGLIAILPLLAGSLVQMLIPRFVILTNSYKKIAITGAFLQALSLFGFAYLSWSGQIHINLLFLIAALYWASGMSTGAAWSAWIDTLVPETERITFFATRGKFLQLFTLIGLLGAGFFLKTFENIYTSNHLYFLLFSFAGVTRLISFGFMSSHSDSKNAAQQIENISLVEFIASARKSKLGKLFIYLVSFQLAVQFSAPYFTPFMLSELKLSYEVFSLLIAGSFITKFLLFPYFGKLSDKVSVTQFLFWGTVGISLIPGLWLISANPIYLFMIQIYGGACWAAQEIGVLLTFFQTIRMNQRTSLLAIFNVLNTAGMVIGAIAGGLLLSYLQDGWETFFWLFSISTVLRIFCIFLIPEDESTQRLRLDRIGFRILGLRPMRGAIFRPVLFASRKKKER